MLVARKLDFCNCRKCRVVGPKGADGQELDFCTCRKCAGGQRARLDPLSPALVVKGWATYQ